MVTFWETLFIASKFIYHMHNYTAVVIKFLIEFTAFLE